MTASVLPTAAGTIPRTPPTSSVFVVPVIDPRSSDSFPLSPKSDKAIFESVFRLLRVGVGGGARRVVGVKRVVCS